MRNPDVPLRNETFEPADMICPAKAFDHLAGEREGAKVKDPGIKPSRDMSYAWNNGFLYLHGSIWQQRHACRISVPII